MNVVAPHRGRYIDAPTMKPLPADLVQRLARAALAEDVGGGDITTECAVPAELTAHAVIIAREPCVVAGTALARAVFAELDPQLAMECLADEGAALPAGQRVCSLAGSARAILTGERTALNFLQRLGGIATLTRQFVEAVRGTGATILDTRKTTPTLRVLEKYAVAVGGAQNHRMGLFDAMMIKDNHRAVLARLGPQALAHAVTILRRQHPAAPVVIEADSLSDVGAALAAGAGQILLDNMTLDELRDAVRLVAGKAKTEASGGIRLANVRAMAETGVDYISIGALTHSARSVDLSLELLDEPAP